MGTFGQFWNAKNNASMVTSNTKVAPDPTNGVAPAQQSMATAGALAAATATKGAAVAGTAAAAAAKKYVLSHRDSDQKTEKAPTAAKTQPADMPEKPQDSETGSTSASEGAAATAKTQPVPAAAEAQIPNMLGKTQDSKTGATPNIREKAQDSKTGTTSAAIAGTAAAGAAGAAAAAKKFSPFQKNSVQKTEPESA